MVDKSSETGMQTHEDNMMCCVRCGAQCACRNIGREHWGFCDTCRIKWCIGENLFSGWREQSDKVFEENRDFLKNFEDLTVYSEFEIAQMKESQRSTE